MQSRWPLPDADGSGPLAGVKVLDLSRILAGPYCTMILADLGADVVKVEHPDGGDETRRWGPPYAPGGDAAYFYACNRGRRGIALDLKAPADHAVVLQLLGAADVVIDNFLPGALERLGLGPELLAEINPALVRCTISGYGRESEKASWPAFDFIIQSYTGILGVTGPDAEHPMKAGVPIADLAAGLYCAIGVLAALREVDETGKGTEVEVALADASASLLVNHAMNYLIGGRDARPLGNAHPSVAPYETIPAEDRLLAVAATTNPHFERLCAVLGSPELVADPRFVDNAARVVNREALAQLLGERLVARPAGEWVLALNEAGVPAAVVNTVGEALDDPDLRHRMVAEIEEGGETVLQLRLPIRFNGAPSEPHGMPPALGAHTDLIRADLEAVG
jgi:crotonobetainyl-CoA:carnitine CoA-transferase CaiB-like acyl-CoA transferase